MPVTDFYTMVVGLETMIEEQDRAMSRMNSR